MGKFMRKVQDNIDFTLIKGTSAIKASLSNRKGADEEMEIAGKSRGMVFYTIITLLVATVAVFMVGFFNGEFNKVKASLEQIKALAP